jgi:hypothetical protein
MKVLGKLLGHFTVKNDYNEDLFIVYFYEEGISFNDDFLRGIIEQENLWIRFMEINLFWKNGFHISENEDDLKSQTMNMIMDLLQENQEQLSRYFNDKPQLNQELDNSQMFLSHLRDNDLLKEITIKEFESKIKDEEIGDYYVENLEKIKQSAKFYTYKSEKVNLDFYLMVVEEKIKIGFADKNK